jgi:hypothetical protein
MSPDSLVGGELVDLEADPSSPLAYLKAVWSDINYAMPVRLAAASGAMPYLLKRKAISEAAQAERAKTEEAKQRQLMFMCFDPASEWEFYKIHLINWRASGEHGKKPEPSKPRETWKARQARLERERQEADHGTTTHGGASHRVA